jgi:hypothetical protein
MMDAVMPHGYALIPYAAKVAKWAAAAHQAALPVVNDPDQQAQWLRHQGTWFVGVDALPNQPDGSINGVGLDVAGLDHSDWHMAQVSVVYPDYPKQDTGESDVNHAFRIRRDAAHVDGLLLDPATGMRQLKEPHGFILGLPLNEVSANASPLVVWKGSHHIMSACFAEVFKDIDPARWADVDVTVPYKAARKQCFETCERIELPARVGEATLLHRHVLHGVAPWGKDASAPPEGRMIAYFRPEAADWADWL